MAISVLKQIIQSARAKWQLKKVAIAHCLGVVPVSEASVIIAVSSAHRKESLAAVTFLIDELKAKVPIWKKEVYAGRIGDQVKPSRSTDVEGGGGEGIALGGGTTSGEEEAVWKQNVEFVAAHPGSSEGHTPSS
ncbi:unnamed protein product [Closterium sp. Naga37s-1]|nr:unnamed protein product [Closterium sp. Naga37s-1]